MIRGSQETAEQTRTRLHRGKDHGETQRGQAVPEGRGPGRAPGSLLLRADPRIRNGGFPGGLWVWKGSLVSSRGLRAPPVMQPSQAAEPVKPRVQAIDLHVSNRGQPVDAGASPITG